MRNQHNMFGLNNYAGSCWVNACLQGIFRIPEVIERYTKETHDQQNPVDVGLNTIWNSKGREGLKEFFNAARTATMPAGQGIGDSNELLDYLCDKLPYLDKLCRFKIAETTSCSCGFSQMKDDSPIQFNLHPKGRQTPIAECIMAEVSIEKLDDWKCDNCSRKDGATMQKLIASFPKVMIFQARTPGTSIQYSSQLVVNSIKYHLLSVISFTGGHWFAHSREMPPGMPWFTLDDTRVRQHSPNEFPMSEMMRLLIYYRLEE
jgi:ubiquitin C-terminal hydrolase